MTTESMLGRVATAIERIVKNVKGGGAPPKRMAPEEFLEHASAEIRKAGTEEPEAALQRLTVLKRNVEAARARFSESQQPSALRAVDNRRPAGRLAKVAKGVEELRRGIDAKTGEKANRPAKTRVGDAWPLDLNTDEFRQGVEKADTAPAWGFDPNDERSPRE
jgi:hypothetical protein